LVSILKEYITPSITIGVHCTLEDIFKIQNPLNENFTNRFLYTKIFVQDVKNPEERALIFEETHCSAHRGLDENNKQFNRLYYWPNFYKKLQEYIKNCTICNSIKYNRHPVLIPIGQAPIPNKKEKICISTFLRSECYVYYLY